jgi:hypothetical protein
LSTGLRPRLPHAKRPIERRFYASPNQIGGALQKLNADGTVDAAGTQQLLGALDAEAQAEDETGE